LRAGSPSRSGNPNPRGPKELERGLPDVDHGEPVKVVGGHLVGRADRSGRKVGAHARPPRRGSPGAVPPGGRSPRSVAPAAPKAGRTRTALAGGSPRPSRLALQLTSASKAFALTTGPETESSSSAEVPPPRVVARRQAARGGRVPLAQGRGRGGPPHRGRAPGPARWPGLDAGARAAADHHAGRGELSKKQDRNPPGRW
jgi:hypothetical protein